MILQEFYTLLLTILIGILLHFFGRSLFFKENQTIKSYVRSKYFIFLLSFFIFMFLYRVLYNLFV
jgi:uncharacterized membrane protein YdjX (TVP38/TMEM64 family)